MCLQPVAATLFGLVERLVSQPEKFCWRVVGARYASGKANADGEVNVVFSAHRAAFFDVFAEGFQSVTNFGLVIIAGENNELFATEAREPVGFPPEMFAHKLCQCLQADVARFMAVIVVDPFEVVGIHHGHCEARMVALAPLKALSEFLIKVASVAQLCQVVGNAKFCERLVGLGQIMIEAIQLSIPVNQ